MTQRIAVFCDETGAHDCTYFGWGSIWCPSKRVNELNLALDHFCRKSNPKNELKWSHTGPSGIRNAAVRWFFETPWVCFYSLWVRRSALDQLTRRNATFAYRKLLYAMLSVRINQFDLLPGGPHEFEVRADQVGEVDPARTRKEFRLLQSVCDTQSPRHKNPVINFQRVDSREHRGIQLADLLVGAIRSSWEGTPSGSKSTISRAISEHLGWQDLRATTENNLKFYIWMPADFGTHTHDPSTRELALKCAHGDSRRYYNTRKSKASEIL